MVKMMSIKDLFQELQGDEDRDDSINAHYGMSDEDYYQKVKEIMCDLIMFDTKTEVIDKHFPRLTNEERCMIQAWYMAHKKVTSMKE